MNAVFLFPGQGVQTLGMGEDFRRAATIPAFALVNQRLEQASDGLGVNVRDIIVKGPPRLLAETWIAQPAIFALSVAIAELLQQRGLQPTIVAGHSLGEFAALVCAGASSFEDMLALVIERGRLMHEVNESIDGAMLAVSGLSPAQLAGLLEKIEAEVWIANDNAPSQYVLSGLRAGLRQASASILQSGGRITWLDVAGSYHTPLLLQASRALQASIASLHLCTPVFPVVANSNAAVLLDGPSIRTELSQHMLSTVNWTGTMRRIAQAGVETLLSIGPGRVLKGLALRNNAALPCRTVGTVLEFDEICRVLESRLCASS